MWLLCSSFVSGIMLALKCSILCASKCQKSFVWKTWGWEGITKQSQELLVSSVGVSWQCDLVLYLNEQSCSPDVSLNAFLFIFKDHCTVSLDLKVESQDWWGPSFSAHWQTLKKAQIKSILLDLSLGSYQKCRWLSRLICDKSWIQPQKFGCLQSQHSLGMHWNWNSYILLLWRRGQHCGSWHTCHLSWMSYLDHSLGKLCPCCVCLHAWKSLFWYTVEKADSSMIEHHEADWRNFNDPLKCVLIEYTDNVARQFFMIPVSPM